MSRPMLVAAFVLAGSLVLSGCKDELAPSRVALRLSVEPSPIPAVPMTGVNAGNSLCTYTIRVHADGDLISNVEWLDWRETLHHALGTDSPRMSAEELSSFVSFFNHPTPFDASRQWAWGGPANLLPITIDHVLYYRHKGDARTDSTVSHVVCQ